MKVMVIFSDPNYSSDFSPFPPIGTIGETISGFDRYNECDVIYENWPCIETPADPSWITHRSMIVELDEDNYLASIREAEATT